MESSTRARVEGNRGRKATSVSTGRKDVSQVGFRWSLYSEAHPKAKAMHGESPVYESMTTINVERNGRVLEQSGERVIRELSGHVVKDSPRLPLTRDQDQT